MTSKSELSGKRREIGIVDKRRVRRILSAACFIVLGYAILAFFDEFRLIPRDRVEDALYMYLAIAGLLIYIAIANPSRDKKDKPPKAD